MTDKVRISPNNIEAEEAVLGCMLLDKNAVSKGIQILTPDSFYKNSNNIIFQCMLDLYDKNENIDTITICEQLKKNKK